MSNKTNPWHVILNWFGNFSPHSYGQSKRNTVFETSLSVLKKNRRWTTSSVWLKQQQLLFADVQNDCLLGLFGLNDTGSDYMFQIYKKDNKHGIIAISVVQHYVERAVCYQSVCIPVNLLHCRDPKQMARLTHTLPLCLFVHPSQSYHQRSHYSGTDNCFFTVTLKKIWETDRNKCDA